MAGIDFTRSWAALSRHRRQAWSAPGGKSSAPEFRRGPNADRTTEHAPDTRRFAIEVWNGLSERQIAAALTLSKTSVGTYLHRARQAGLRWPLPESLDDGSLELLLFPAARTVPDPNRPVPDWASIDRELGRPG